jgi:hypothetical protein
MTFAMARRPRPATRGPLRPDGAFVVQLRTDADGRERLSGRVEHVTSGRSEQFESLAELLRFIESHANRKPGRASRRQPSSGDVVRRADERES